MSTVEEPLRDVQQILTELFAPIATELVEVDRRLQAELRHEDPFIDNLAQHSFRLGGKRLRPALLLLSAQAVGDVTDSHRVLATVVEMIHTATLVHDDVLDEASIRRHASTVNVRWNNQTSVLLGDYLFTHAFYLASTLDTTFGCRTIGEATNTVCEGELQQTAASGRFELTRDEYFQIIDSKTARLCACCCLLGAHDAGGTQETVQRLASYGRHVGVAFQIADDLLDLEGDQQLTGKSLGTDLYHRKMTLPLIYLRDQLDEAEREELRQLVNQPSNRGANILLDWLDRSGAMQQAVETAVEYGRQAAAELECLPDSLARQSLHELAAFAASRRA